MRVVVASVAMPPLLRLHAVYCCTEPLLTRLASYVLLLSLPASPQGYSNRLVDLAIHMS